MPKRKNKKIKFLALILALVFLFAPFSFQTKNRKVIQAEESLIFPFDEDSITEITNPNHWWHKDDNVVIDGVVIVKSGAGLFIEKGSTIKFEKKDGEIPPFIYVEDGGIIFAEGDEENKIIFTSDQEDSYFSIIFAGDNDGGTFSGFLRYVEISKAGGNYELEIPIEDPNQTLVPFGWLTVFAEENEKISETRYPIKHLGGILMLENCRFYNNKEADIYIAEQEINPEPLAWRNNMLVSVVNSNFENNQTNVAVRADYFCSEGVSNEQCNKIVVLKNNWYGKNTGSYLINRTWQNYLENKETLDQFADLFGVKIIGKYGYYDGYRKKDLIADPAIIIPGIMGSAEEMIGNELVLDPILHTYDDLINSLETNGYENGINLFFFPYDWRNSNVLSAQKLSEKLMEIQTAAIISKVDIVTHSMGGLIARQYIQGENYYNSIDQLVTLGTPHKGAPIAYLQWEAGEGFETWREKIAKWHFTREAKHNGYDDIFSYIRNRIHSVKELLPNYSYLYDVELKGMKEYPEGYPRNYFLENLNGDSLANLQQVKTLNIVGKLEDKTITKIRVEDFAGEDIWEDGKPQNYDNNPEQGLDLGEGDETVPISSAKGIEAQETIELETNHSELPTKSQCYVFKELTGLENCDYDEDIHIPNILMFNVFSPIDIQIVAPDGKKIGKNFEHGEVLNEIELAYYSGFETEDEFITIPNPLEGEYKILTQATSLGNYQIQAVGIKEENNKAEESLKIFEGNVASVGEINEMEIKIEEGKIQDLPIDNEKPEIEIIYPEERDYLSDEDILIDYTVSDNQTVEKNLIKEVFLDKEKFTEEKINLALEKTGQHIFSIKAEDEAKNSEEKIVGFNIKADYNSVVNNLKTYKNQGWVGKKEYTFFKLQLENLERLEKVFEKHKKFIWPKKNRKKAEEIFDKLIDHRLENLIYLAKKKIKNSEARGLVVDRLEFIRKN